MPGSGKSLRWNNQEHSGILIGPSMAPRFFGLQHSRSSRLSIGARAARFYHNKGHGLGE
jgi:hypothetical protein